MSYDTTYDRITVEGKTYDVERETDNRNGDERLTIEEFPGLEGTLGYEQYDQEFANPRDWSNVGRMAVCYRGYELGDKDEALTDGQSFEITCPNCDQYGQIEEDGESIDCPKCDGYCMIEVDPATYYKQKRGARVVLPLFVYEHSGITMRAGAPIEALKPEDVRSTGRFMGDDAGWDTSFVGFTFDTPETLKETMGDDVSDEDIATALKDEVEIYARYLEGDVTFYNVEDSETGFMEGCGGYVGDHEHCENECFVALEAAIEARLAEQRERAHWAARDTATI